MKVSSKNVLGILASALMAGGLMSACSSTKTGDAGPTTGGTGGTGGVCGAVATVCTVSSECCSGLTCSGGLCSSACGALTDSCSSSSPCCSPLTCDSSGDANNGTCIAANAGTTGGTSGGACPTNPAGGGCITAADCSAPNLCQPSADGGGYCGPVTGTPSAVCLANGATCSSTTGQPCCGGSCVGGTCVARTACGIAGAGCNVAGDCCNNFKCVQGAGADGNDGGTDGGACGLLTAACTLPTDCCTGLVCDTSGDGTNDTCIAGPDAGIADAGTATDGGTTPDAGAAPDAGSPTFTGTCQASCSAELGPCSTTNGNADCCVDQGFTCLSIDGGTTAGVCDYAQYTDSSGNAVFCGGPCSSLPCQLSVSCQIPTSGAAAGVDPCAAAGLVCDQTGSVCRFPAEQETCLPGGPACEPLANSTVTDIQCLPAPTKFGGGNYSCLQPCSASDPASGTSDCVDALTQCLPLGGSLLGSECFPNEGCTTSFGGCDSSAVGDGVCVPYNFSGGQEAGLCFQATLTGGTPGSACDSNNNRQNGGFCDPTSFCVAGLCEASCNAGSGGTPACAQDDAGPTVACQPIFGQTGDSADFGTCSVNCDFTSSTGGGCVSVDGVPEKCLPPADFGFADAPTGICIEAPESSAAVAVGQPCSQGGTLADDCVDGALCLGNGVTLPFTCVQLCTDVNATGQAPCKADQTCNALNFGTPLAHEGFCGLADGSFGG